MDYFVCKWLYDQSFDIHCKKYQGIDGLYQVFKSICDDITPGKKIMVSLVNYYSKLTEKPAPIVPSPYEYYLFNKEAFQKYIEPLNLHQVFTYYLSGIQSIHPSQYNEKVCQLIALMYGVPIQTHIMELDDMYPFYEMGVKSIISTSINNNDHL
ncbi:hypothetical protein [Lysinibacillus antri]|uniref:Uncharacterized protein n=1 Tax=Lysinibacillus antri TaxID=2498145 RepID=A0A3S0R7B7_9BACI|nr:hypothetical protein [Lysinibacillus antri]RUL54651.1 hypothetical protein EK386_05660 [Lysinibacillus antri]